MILQEIAGKAKERVEEKKKTVSLEALIVRVGKMDAKKRLSFYEAISGGDISFICEIKKASPSKGIIAEDFPYIEIAKDYEKAGASAISVLTEPYYFKGSDDYLSQISEAVDLPILRKDFTVDPYQIYEAKLLGASAVLLICEILREEQIREYLKIAEDLGLSALVEAHTETEVKKAVRAGAQIIGVNNRDLKTFEVDIHTSERLRECVPDHVLFVSESGIRTSEDIESLRKIKTNAVLIGETLMRSPNKKRQLMLLRGEG